VVAQCSRLWTECARRRYDFERPARTATALRALTLDGMRAFYGAYVAADGERRQRLSTHVFAPSSARKEGLQLDALPEDLYPAEPDRLPPVIVRVRLGPGLIV
jgi:insulysin